MNTRFALSLTFAGLLAVPALAWSPDAHAEDPAAAPEAADADIQKLIRDLGDDSFETRTKATESLRKLGPRAAPALRKAMKEADSEEVRWRAEQLLMRLDGTKSRSLGGAGDKPAAKDPLEHLRRQPWKGPSTNADDILKTLREQMKQLDKQFEDLRKRPEMGAFRSVFSGSVAVPGLRLDTLGLNRVRLRVKADAGTETTYEGTSLDDILTKHPSLADHAQMNALKDKLKSSPWAGFSDFKDAFEVFRGLSRGGQARIGIEMDENGNVVTRHVDIQKTDTGTKVKITEKDTNGRETITEVEGESLEAIKRDNPKLAKKLDGVRIQLSLPQVFWGERKRKRGLERDPAVVTPATPAAPKRVFGISVDSVSESLASQLGISVGAGVIVSEIVPGSAAEQIGLKRYDILLAVDDVEVSIANVKRLLAAKIDPATPVRLAIMRRAKRETLSR